jgi:hypothetical protein
MPSGRFEAMRRAFLVVLSTLIVGGAARGALASDEFTLRKIRKEDKKLILYHDPIRVNSGSAIRVRFDLPDCGCAIEPTAQPAPIRPGDSYATLMALDRGGTRSAGMGRHSAAILGAVKRFLREEIPRGNKDEYAIADSSGGGHRVQETTPDLGPLEGFIDALPPPSGNGANIYSVADRSLAQLERSTKPLRAALIISDGYDPLSPTDEGPNQLIQHARALEVPVFAIIINRESDPDQPDRRKLQGGQRRLARVAHDTSAGVIDTLVAGADLEDKIYRALTKFSAKLGEVQKTTCTLCGDTGRGGDVHVEMSVASGEQITWQSRQASPGGVVRIASVGSLARCACQTSDDCPRGEQCSGGVCAAPCTSSSECACSDGGQAKCNAGRCECAAACGRDSDCPRGSGCVDGKCSPSDAAAAKENDSTLLYALGLGGVALGGILLFAKRSRRRRESPAPYAGTPAPPPAQRIDLGAGAPRSDERRPIDPTLPMDPVEPAPYCLIGVEGRTAGLSFALPIGDIVAGADPSCQIVLSMMGTVSGSHACFRVDSKRITVTDLGSSNGTFLKGIKIEPNRAVELRPGDRIALSKAAVFELTRAVPKTMTAGRERTRLKE